MNDFMERTHWCQAQCQGNVSSLLLDTCRAEIYHRQRNSCWSRRTHAISPADHPAGKLRSQDRLEHRRRSQCTQSLRAMQTLPLLRNSYKCGVHQEVETPGCKAKPLTMNSFCYSQCANGLPALCRALGLHGFGCLSHRKSIIVRG
jgi:hypothetical protein